MPIRLLCRAVAVMCALSAAVNAAVQQKRPWKGYSILGNGHVTAVYSDDSRITDLTHASGIQHFYFRDYTADYVASTSFDVMETGARQVGMKNFFTARTTTHLPDGSVGEVLCYVHPSDAVVLSL